MTLYFLPNGLGEALGDPLAVTEPLYIAGSAVGVKYVSSLIGDDTNDGDREAPYATLAKGVSMMGAGDVLVLMDGHTETLTSAQTVAVSCTIIGAGSSGGYPTVKLTNNAAATNMLILTGEYVQVRNIWFNTNAQSCSAPLIKFSGSSAHFRMHGCYFECSYTDQGGTILLNLDGEDKSVALKNNTFISTATVRDERPEPAIALSDDLGLLTMDGDVFDAGTVGWDSGTAVRLKETDEEVNYFWAENVSFLRGADCELEEAVTRFYINMQTSTGSAVRF